MRGEILGVERRRLWSDEDKLSILLAVGVNGATVTQVAQRYEVTRQQIYTWRKSLKRKGLWPAESSTVFLPLDVPAGQEAESRSRSMTPETGFAEIAFAKGRQLRVSSSLDDATLTRLIRVVETA